MKLRIIAAGLILMALFAGAVQAQEFVKSIMTGGPRGTYIEIGKDLANLSAECGSTLNVLQSAGSLENLVTVKKRSNTQFGIVQSDVLEYVRTYAAADPELQRSLLGVRIMYPLFNEEVHVLADRNVSRLSDLAGKKIAVGSINGGTFLTATLILDILKIDAERVTIGPSDAFPKLMNGEIDALFYVSGVPTDLFSDTAIDGSRFHLLDIMEPELLATYTAAEIPGGAYPFQPDPVNSIAVKAVLMTYDYAPGKNDYHRQSCKTVSDTSNLILKNLERLRSSGHPKWKEVDLAQVPPGWKVGNCVKAGMLPDYKLACTPTKTSAAVERDTDREYLKLLKQQFNN